VRGVLVAAAAGPGIGVRSTLCLDKPYWPPIPSRFKRLPDVWERAPGTQRSPNTVLAWSRMK